MRKVISQFFKKFVPACKVEVLNPVIEKGYLPLNDIFAEFTSDSQFAVNTDFWSDIAEFFGCQWIDQNSVSFHQKGKVLGWSNETPIQTSEKFSTTFFVNC